jgi:hypothetical protein
MRRDALLAKRETEGVYPFRDLRSCRRVHGEEYESMTVLWRSYGSRASRSRRSEMVRRRSELDARLEVSLLR